MKVPCLLAIVAPTSLAAETSWFDSARAGGLDAVLVRDRENDDVDRLARLERFVAAGRRSPGSLRPLASGRCDLARAAGAAGVHLPSDGIPVAAARTLLPPGALVGCSTHHLEEVRRATQEGADYVVFGPIWPTPGKGPALGLDQLASACRLGVAVLALGGVTPERFADCAAAGARGAAGIRLVADPSALGTAVAAANATFQRPSEYHPAP